MFGGADADYWERIRSKILPLIGKQLAKFNKHFNTDYYVEYIADNNSYICTIHRDEEQLEKDLEKMGFNRNPISAFKRIKSTNIQEEGSWYLIHGADKTFNTTLSDNALQYHRDRVPAYQLHIVLYEIDGDRATTAVLGHHELWWGSYPLKHYNVVYYDIDVANKMFMSIAKEYYGENFGDVVKTTPIHEIQ